MFKSEAPGQVAALGTYIENLDLWEWHSVIVRRKSGTQDDRSSFSTPVAIGLAEIRMLIGTPPCPIRLSYPFPFLTLGGRGHRLQKMRGIKSEWWALLFGIVGAIASEAAGYLPGMCMSRTMRRSKLRRTSARSSWRSRRVPGGCPPSQFQGLRSGTPVASKSATFRVTTVIP
jgi:hypothetical protein